MPLSREDQAKLEIGHTDISRPRVWTLTAAFLVLIFSVPVVQQIREWRTGGTETGVRRFVSLPAVAAREMRAALAAAPASNAAPVGVLFGAAPRTRLGRLFRYNSILLRDMQRFDDDLVAESQLTRALIPPVQEFLTGRLGAGNEQAYVGRGRWLFYRPDIDYVVGPGFLEPKRIVARARGGNEWRAAPQPDPLIAIFQFHKQLAARGIPLLIVVAPPKSVVHPERFSSRYDAVAEPVQNPSYAQFVRELAHPDEFFRRWEAILAPYRHVPEAKARRAWHWQFTEALRELEAARDLIVSRPVLLYDPTQDLVAARRQSGQPQYLETDTHWTPAAMQMVAARLRDVVERHVGPSPAVLRCQREAMTVTNLGDIAVMMRLPAGQRLYGGQAVTVRPVVRGEMQWRPERDADVLLLGDSFCNIYSAGGMGWGEAAGLAEQLSAELGRPLDLIVRNDAGAFATREMLNQELAQGRDRLAGKKLVIWEFAGRELACGDWRVKSTPMTLGQARASRYLQVAPGESLLASGTVQEISAAPRPGTVTYRDHVVQAHLTDLADAAGQPLAATAALVALYSMRDQVWTAAARYRPGQRITLRLRNYDEMDRAAKIGSVKCSLLTGEMEFETPCWGEEPLADAGAAAGAERPAGAGAACWSGGETAGLLTVVAGVLAALACVERRERRERGRKI